MWKVVLVFLALFIAVFLIADKSKSKSFSTKTVTFVGVLAAIFVILSYLSIGTNNFKVSAESFAILIGSFTMGPVTGCLIGFIGEFIKQLLLYGFDATTLLWTLPYALEGLIAGFIVKKSLGNVPKKKLIASVVVGEITLTALITPVNAISAIIQGWGTWATILAGIPLRLAIMAVRIIIYIIILPTVYNSIKKVVK